MNDAMKYLIDCIRNEKKPSGKKLKLLNQEYSHKDAYVHVHGKKYCVECHVKEASFKNLKKGFGKFCSKDCTFRHLSKTNKSSETINKLKEKQKSRLRKLDLKYEKIIDSATKEYLNSSLTIKEVAEKNNIPHSRLRKHISSKKLLKNRNDYDVKVGKRKDDLSVQELNEKIDHKIKNNKEDIERLFAQGYIAQNIADIYGCSKNFICKKFREHGIKIPNKSISSHEKKVQELLNLINAKYITNNRKIIGKELDIYLPNKNLAIEINGVYWHSEQHLDKNYHLNKSLFCEQKNIKLIQFWDYELEKKEHIVYSIILNQLGISDKIYARECKIKEIDFHSKKKFLIENHISGDVPSSKNFGLFFENELVSIMTFGKTRFNKKYEYELLRFCNKKYKNIVGGKEKLFKFFIKHYSPKSIISYSQKRIFSGNMYNKLGFKFVHNTLPNYFWTRNGKILSRYECQKHRLDTLMTEREYMQSLKYYRVFDCGNSVWVWEDAKNSF